MSALPTEWGRGPATRLLEEPGARGVLLCTSRDPDAKLTFLVTDQAPGQERVAVKIPSTDAASSAIDAETRALVEIERLGLGALSPTVPKYVVSLDLEGRLVLVSSAVVGSPMSIAYHHWPHTARESAVTADFAAAFGWLEAFQTATAQEPTQHTWPARVLDAVRTRLQGHPDLDVAVARLESAVGRLDGCVMPSTAVHGDFWFGNVLVHRRAVSGVVDWEAGSPSGSPLRDAVRFVLSYSLYLDRHTRAGRRVFGHPGLRRVGFGPGIAYALCSSGWLPELVRGTLARHLERLGVDPELWYDVALTGIGEVAAFANADDFGAGHLRLLAELPPDGPPRAGGSRR